MKQGLTELILILDRSGSMGGLEDDTIGGCNALLDKQKKLPGACHVTTVLFDDHYVLLHDRVDLREVRPLTREDYYVRGSTALLDAMGITISRAGNLQKYLDDKEKAEHVVVAIITDGMENASREYGANDIKAMVERQQKRFGWEFVFLGANMDAVAAAGKVGISRERAVRYRADSEGTQLNYAVLSDVIRAVRSSDAIEADWMQEIERDYRSREKK